MGASIATYYDILRVEPEAGPAGVRAAYRALAQKYHPDKLPGSADDAEKVMAMLNEAYTVLSDPQQRARYDRRIARALASRQAIASSPAPLGTSMEREAIWPWGLLFATIAFSVASIGTVAWRVAVPTVAKAPAITVQAGSAK